MILSAIVAISSNNVIGKDNDLPWYLPADLKYFKKTTLGHPVIMGRKSYESIGRPLPKRTNIVVTRDPYFISSNILVAHSIGEAVELARDTDSEEVFIIGGAMVYEHSLPHLNRLYITEVHGEFEGDTFFPEWNPEEWKLVSEEPHLADDKNEYNYVFKVYERI
ncbi:type 3 dihydrofolate reductase [Membranicola marinus]|uniref:Dihydrofolate reductase n=1 Tax=Membranihabitans marinus TaxID=1227546 RepID=A0A953HLJ6_9BACT|nr:type 3 dihydrofolate reductase [Membranihabitans marinus]MBY5958179.1 type 3 dihydrofolate reductase [Membranihabitans marinus]